jgi:hypothetical protein
MPKWWKNDTNREQTDARRSDDPNCARSLESKSEWVQKSKKKLRTGTSPGLMQVDCQQ